MSFRQLVLVTHRWLGLGSSGILAIVGLTGAAFFITPGFPLRRIGGLHENLALGIPGAWIVTIATASAVLLELGGCFLWWKQKLLRVRSGKGWRQTLTDLHHVVGAVGFVLMFLLALSGVFAAFLTPKRNPKLRKVVMDLHTARTYPWPVKVLYVVGTTGFFVQGATGIVMWWKPKRARN